MVPYEPLDGQLIALQFRLLRAARAMLDPMLNLGLLSREQAGRLLTEEVMLSAPMARQELDRYTFRAPGQAGSYFYGYTRLLERCGRSSFRRVGRGKNESNASRLHGDERQTRAQSRRGQIQQREGFGAPERLDPVTGFRASPARRWRCARPVRGLWWALAVGGGSATPYHS